MSSSRGKASGCRRHVLTGLASILVVSACGLPGDGVVRVDDASVPYRLLEPGQPSPSEASVLGQPSRAEPLLFWLDASERLVPTAAGASCRQPAAAQVADLLDELSSGPSERERAAGRASAWAQPARLELVDLDDTTAVVELDPQLPTSAERLPLAVGQIVLAVTSARGVGAVAFVADGQPVQVPLPGGALTDGPVTASDYAELVGGERSSSAERWPGCP